MKIGEVSRIVGVPIATIRYYIKEALLFPDKSNPQYDFTEREIDELQQIIKMKNLHFSIDEIRNSLALMRYSNPTVMEADKAKDLLSILNSKKASLNREIEHIQHVLGTIDQEIALISNYAAQTKSTQKIGISIHALDLLACPHCGRPLRLQAAVFENGYVLSGDLTCSAEGCPGYSATVVDGIVETGNLYTGTYDRPNLNRILYHNMGFDLCRDALSASERLKRELFQIDLHGKVVLEHSVNSYFFLYPYFHDIPNDATIIVADKYPEVVRMYKELIEALPKHPNVLFLADALADFPLRKECVDLYISFMTEGEYQLYHPNCFLTDAHQYLKQTAKILGVYRNYPREAVSRRKLREKYPESSEHYKVLDDLREEYSAAGFDMTVTQVGVSTEINRQDFTYGCHIKGEPLFTHYFSAVRHRT